MLAYGASIEILRDAEDEIFSCNVELRGGIVRGDVARLSAAFKKIKSEAKSNRVLCLESPGGSYTEGIDIALFLRKEMISAKLERGAECYSACAIAFMGGSFDTESGRGTIAHRIMHSTSVLGFHAPYIDVPTNSYNKDEVDEAYRQAVLSIGYLLSQSENLSIRRALIVKMLSKGSKEFYYVNTIDQLGRYGIGLHGWDVPPPQASSIFFSCLNNIAWRYERSGSDLIPASILPEVYSRWLSEFRAGRYRKLVFDVQIAFDDGSRACRVHFHGGKRTGIVGANQDDIDIDTDMTLVGNSTRLQGKQWSRFPGSTELQSLPRGSFFDGAY